MVKKILLFLLLGLIAIQFVPVDKSNPAEPAPIVVEDAQIKSFLDVSCMDCHSNNTVWPWYASIAPISWKIEEHVLEGRDELNFSEWENYSSKKKIHKLEEMYEETAEGHMPEGQYELLHEGAEVNEEELKMLKVWVDNQIAILQAADSSSVMPLEGS